MIRSNGKNLANAGRVALFSAALLWGISFVVMKNVLDNIPTLYILSIRFLGAALLLLPACAKKLKALSGGYITGGLLMGAVLVVAYVFQTYGLNLTTPGKNAFLTSIYCVIVPFLYWASKKRKPGWHNASAAALCVAGVGFISLDGALSIGLGDVLTMFCGLFFALHIVITAHTVTDRDPVALAMCQFFSAGLIALFCALVFESPPVSLAAGDIWGMAYLTVACTAGCILMQVFGQKYTPPSQAAIIMTFEAVFGAAASIALYGEVLTLRLSIGFALTFAAVLISETKSRPLRKPKRG